MPSGSPWLLTLRGSSCCLPGIRPRIEACLHGARVHVALEGISKLQELVQSLGQFHPAVDDGTAVATEQATSARRGIPDVCDLAITCRNLAVDLPPLPMGQPLRFIVPGIDVSTATSADTYLSPPPVPLWHAEPPGGGGQTAEPDFTVYGCTCRPGASAELLAGAGAGGLGQALLTERQFRAAAAPPPAPVELPSAEVQRLLHAKLRASELMSEREALAEALHAQSVQAVANEKRRRIPLVQELLEEFPDSAKNGPIAVQLNNLESEARDLEERRRGAEAAWRALSRGAGEEAAAAGAECLGREAGLRRQLEREETITAALNEMVDWQASQIAMLQRLEERARVASKPTEAEG